MTTTTRTTRTTTRTDEAVRAAAQRLDAHHPRCTARRCARCRPTTGHHQPTPAPRTTGAPGSLSPAAARILLRRRLGLS